MSPHFFTTAVQKFLGGNTQHFIVVINEQKVGFNRSRRKPLQKCVERKWLVKNTTS
jgi:hypothetical protein